MPQKTDADDFTELQTNILETALQNPEMSHAEIAAELDCSESYVRSTRNEYEDNVELQKDSGGSFLGPVILLILLGAIAVEMGLI